MSSSWASLVGAWALVRPSWGHVRCWVAIDQCCSNWWSYLAKKGTEDPRLREAVGSHGGHHESHHRPENNRGQLCYCQDYSSCRVNLARIIKFGHGDAWESQTWISTRVKAKGLSKSKEVCQDLLISCRVKKEGSFIRYFLNGTC